MVTKEEYEAMEFIDKISAMRNAGYSDSEIAEFVGKEIGDGKISAAELRDFVAQKKRKARDGKMKQVKELIDAGYSLTEAGEKLGLTYAEAKTLSLMNVIRKGESNEG